MPSRYFQEGPRRRGGVQALFGSIARRYDLINDVQSLGLHRVWKRRLVRWTGARPGEKALDLCCGTGDVARELVRAGIPVLGVDFSRPMLQVARCHPGCSGGATPVYVVADALRLPVADESVDVVTISYGLRNLPDYEAGLREMRRISRPGGRLVTLDFGKPAACWLRMPYDLYLRWMLPVLGWLLAGDAQAYRYIRDSLEVFPDAAGIAELLRRTGWTSVESRPILGGTMVLHRAVCPWAG